MISEKPLLQCRAEEAAKQFQLTARKPIIIEFAGIPKAGKTTTLNNIHSFFRRCGFRVEVVIERASVCPIRDKKHSNFNVWTACTTLSQILEKTQTPPQTGDPDILILDRGIFDSLLWFAMMERLARVRKGERKILEEFLLMDEWRTRLSGVILMTANPKDAMEREKGFLPVAEVVGSIMNEEVLTQMKKTLDETVQRFQSKFRILEIDTSSGETRNDPKRSFEVVAETVLSWIEEELQEEILYLPKTSIKEIFLEQASVKSNKAKELSDCFCKKGKFSPRKEVEDDEGQVQALPIVIVRNKSGQILRLRRKEKSEDNTLHKKVVIWAGGHVRKDDEKNGNPLVHGAVRELQEELRLSIEPDTLKLLGAVYFDQGERIGKHVAIVYEWFAETDDVSVALSRAEFFERRGNSLSGSFVNVESLIQDVESGKVSEAWSSEIVRSLLGGKTKGITGSLFRD